MRAGQVRLAYVSSCFGQQTKESKMQDSYLNPGDGGGGCGRGAQLGARGWPCANLPCLRPLDTENEMPGAAPDSAFRLLAEPSSGCSCCSMSTERLSTLPCLAAQSSSSCYTAAGRRHGVCRVRRAGSSQAASGQQHGICRVQRVDLAGGPARLAHILGAPLDHLAAAVAQAVQRLGVYPGGGAPLPGLQV